MIFCSSIFFFFGVYFYEYNIIFFFEWVIYFLNSSSFTCIFLFDWISFIFISFVFLISGCVLFYSLGYMKGDLNLIRFYFLVFLFILSMFFFIFMPDLICLLLGWDGLGLVSYCLVIYYQNKMSLISGLITVFMNRLGDVMLILSIGWFFNFGSWHYLFYMNCDLNEYFIWVIYLVLFASFTKSAQFPFCYWLPMAMSAPTPVSSLVHSSTLVTSGVYLIIRFNYYIYFFDTYFLMLISLITMFISGFSACVEMDLKKIIAFSTLSQLGFMFFTLSFGCVILCFLHLLIHAIFKSLLFLCSGYFIHCFFGNQDIRYMGGLVNQNPYVSCCFLISLLCLCGFPFFSGFYSSDFILEMVLLMDINILYFVFFFFSVCLTLIYSIRLVYYLFYSDSFFFSFISFLDCSFMNYSLIILFFFSLFSGSYMFWFFNDLLVYVVDDSLKMLPLFFFFFFFFWNFFEYYYFYLKNFIFFFFSSMWFLNFFSSNFIVIRFFYLSNFLNTLFEQGWIEYFVSSGLLGFFKWLGFYFDKFLVNNFKVYVMFFFFFYLFLIFF